jgi:CRISPR/Cas system CSM-associated protein Csm3 (group 7 of RAMP superfamily)
MTPKTYAYKAKTQFIKERMYFRSLLLTQWCNQEKANTNSQKYREDTFIFKIFSLKLFLSWKVFNRIDRVGALSNV